MKKNVYCLFLSIFLFIWFTAISQGVTIGSTLPPNNSAILDLQSDSKGFLPPRVTTAQRNLIASPASGLVVFDTDVNQLYLYDGLQWQQLSGGSESSSVYPRQQGPPVPDQKSGERFGADVAISDNYAVVGAMYADDGAITSTGAAYVFRKGSFGSWSQVAKLYPSDPQSNALFGTSVAIAGNYIVVGAPWFGSGAIGQSGKVYVFVKGLGDVWTQQTSFTRPLSTGGPAGGDYFGYDVAISTSSISGPVIVIGAPNVSSFRGQAYSYRFNFGTWFFNQTFNPIDLLDQDNFGSEVNVDGDYCVIGAPKQDYFMTNNSGAVYIFFYNGSLWAQQQKIPFIIANAQGGYSFSLKGDMLAIGSPFASNQFETAKVYILQRSGISWSIIQFLYLYSVQGFNETSNFGLGVALDNDKLLVSIPASYMNHMGTGGGTYVKGYVLVYKKGLDGQYHARKLINDNEPAIVSNGNYFGNAVSMQNGYYIIGIPGKAVNDLDLVGTVAFGFIE